MSTPRAGLVALVADPSLYTLRIVRSVLARAGIRCLVEAFDGAEALSALAERKPDILILSWDLLVVPAREIVALARDPVRSHAPGMPILVTMAEPTRSAVEGAIALGVSSILATPFAPKHLRTRVEALIAPEREAA